MTIDMVLEVRDSRGRSLARRATKITALWTQFETRSTDDCMPCPWNLSAGAYPYVSPGGLAARVVCESAHGRSPMEGSQVSHTCESRACLNPKHLRWVRPGEIRRRPRSAGATRIQELREIYSTSDTDACIPFKHGQNKAGYPSVWKDGKNARANRVVCEWTHGPASFDDAEASHECGVRACVNPRHISWKTPKGNSADRIRHGTSSRDRTELRKLTNEQAVDIRGRQSTGETIPSLAREYGVDKNVIRQIVLGMTYREAKG
jgi:hypothetical protein